MTLYFILNSETRAGVPCLRYNSSIGTKRWLRHLCQMKDGNWRSCTVNVIGCCASRRPTSPNQGSALRLLSLEREIGAGEKHIYVWHRANADSRRLEITRGMGPLTASALAASITDPQIFKSGRMMPAWIGLTPRQNSTGSKVRMGRISKQRDRFLLRAPKQIVEPGMS